MRKVDQVPTDILVDQVVSMTCDFCGKDIPLVGNRYKHFDYHDGFVFSYRESEEDEIVIYASDVCDECYEDYQFHERIANLAVEIHKIAPFARVTLGPALEAGDFPESLKKSVDTSIDEE